MLRRVDGVITLGEMPILTTHPFCVALLVAHRYI
jgi:hypothetical protein